MLFAQPLLEQLPQAFQKFGIRSLVDAPCGDMNWMKRLQYEFDLYIGIDIVPEIVEQLRCSEWPENYHFQVGNISTDLLPIADAVFCRDCLVHLSFDDAMAAVDNFVMSGFKYAFLTTYYNRDSNSDCETGRWRPLNMHHPPFNFWEPLALLKDRPQSDRDPYYDKCIGVWKF